MATARSKGRGKVEMAKMSKESNLLVTFSKRRVGLSKKASELSTLCDAETAVIAFSPGEKVYSFGHPSVDTIVDRFLTQNPVPIDSTLQPFEDHRSANIHQLNKELTLANKALEAEKKQGEALEKMRKESQEQCWWAGAVEDLSLEQLELLKISLEALKKDVLKQGNKLISEAFNPMPFLAPRSMGENLPHDLRMVGSHPLGYHFGYGDSSF